MTESQRHLVTFSFSPLHLSEIYKLPLPLCLQYPNLDIYTSINYIEHSINNIEQFLFINIANYY